MYRINYLNRPVLITPDEVLFHAATNNEADPRLILPNIIVAEERIIAPALCDTFYYDLIEKKNQRVTALNQASLLVQINASLVAAGKDMITAADLPIDTWVNAIEFCSTEYRDLWEMFLWKLTAEAVDFMTTMPSWLQHTAAGQQKNNPEVIGGSQGGSVTGDMKDIKFKMDKQLQDRIDPLIERMHAWICGKKANYPLYCKQCACEGIDGVAFKRKTDWVFYDDDEGCGCEPFQR